MHLKFLSVNSRQFSPYLNELISLKITQPFKVQLETFLFYSQKEMEIHNKNTIQFAFPSFHKDRWIENMWILHCSLGNMQQISITLLDKKAVTDALLNSVNNLSRNHLSILKN